MNKNQIRTDILKRRKQLKRQRLVQKSKRTQRRLIQSKEFLKAKTIMFYITKDNEVDTQAAIELALRKGKTVCAPRVNRIKHKLKPIVINCLKKDLQPGCYGIREPKSKKYVSTKNIDLIIVPGIAFDLRGHRLGWGQAYYDNFLGKLKDKSKIGLAFEFQIVSKLPSQNHDVPMDKVITEKRTIKAKLI